VLNVYVCAQVDILHLVCGLSPCIWWVTDATLIFVTSSMVFVALVVRQVDTFGTSNY
jgi:hypothetical protein